MSIKNLELGRFIDWDRGQNYPFNACMAKLMECLGGDPAFYTYDFFAGLSGDDFVMCYGNNDKFNDCVSVCADTEAFLARVFGMIGLEYRLVKHSEWTINPDHHYGIVKAFIDREIPVLCAGVGSNSNYDLLISYDDETKKCHLSCGDDVQYGTDIPFREIECDLIFIESLPHITDLAEIYRKAVEQLPALMTAKPTADGVYFGADAYHMWAKDIENGRYDAYSDIEFNAWQNWQIYICNIATNGGHGASFLKEALRLNPDMIFINELIHLFAENEKIWGRLEGIGAGFGFTLAVLQDAEKRAEILRALAELQETNHSVIRAIPT